MTEPKRPITADDLLTLQSVGDPQISPDGAHVAFVRTIVDRDKNKTRGEIWLVSADGSRAPRRFTGGTDSVGGPRWSPDGTTDRVRLGPAGGDGASLPYSRRRRRGAAADEVGTRFHSGFALVRRWFASRVPVPSHTRRLYEEGRTEERKEKGLSSPPRVHTALAYRQDGFGYWDGSYWQVYVANAETGEARALTSGDSQLRRPLLVPGRQRRWRSCRTGGRIGTRPARPTSRFGPCPPKAAN